MSQPQVVPNTDDPPASWIVGFWASVFGFLAHISFLRLLRWAVPWLRDTQRSYGLVEFWVVANTVLALSVALIAYVRPAGVAVGVLLVYGALRVFEIFVTQVNVLLFDQWRAERDGRSYALRSYRRLLVLLLHNFAEVIGWFLAALLTFHAWSWVQLDDPSLSASFRATLLAMVAFSVEGVRPVTRLTAAVLTIQAVVGVFMTLLTLGRFVSLMPTPRTQEPAEQESSV